MIENDPSPPVVADRAPTVVTVAPAMGAELESVTLPVTLVRGSGIVFKVIVGAAPVSPAKSVAMASIVNAEPVFGTVNVY